MTCILGINHFFHDSSACLLIDGRLVAALEEERFTRKKHTSVFPAQSIAHCLRIAGIGPRDIDHIALSVSPTQDLGRKLAYGLARPMHWRPFLRHELINAYGQLRELGKWYADQFAGLRPPPLHHIPHHLAHAAGSFLASPYEEAAILSVDGSGEWATSFLGAGRGIDVEHFGTSYFPMSLGSFYEAATEFCGFRPNYDEGKTMGLAPFGDARRFHDIVARIARVDGQGRIRIDLSYFDYPRWGRSRCGPKFHATFGRPRTNPDAGFEAHQQDVAAAFQRVLEECALTLARQLKRRTNARYLVIAGGVALNSVMNGRLLREAGFDDIYVMPAAGDNGTSIGAAFYLYHAVLRHRRRAVHDNPYLGTRYGDDEIERLLRQCKLPYAKSEDIARDAALLLADGHILGWLQGRMEIGPRALGNRSILANAAMPEMKAKINAEVKHREPYRPFAPSTPVAFKDRWFDIKGESPFMLKVCDVRQEAKTLLPAIAHVDGTARLQTVRPEINPIYHDLLTKFGALTGVPVLLNTSFNIQGEPIVESPIQAVRCFYSTGLDYLALGGFLVGKPVAPLHVERRATGTGQGMDQNARRAESATTSAS